MITNEQYMADEIRAFTGALFEFHAKGSRALVACFAVDAERAGDTEFRLKTKEAGK